MFAMTERQEQMALSLSNLKIYMLDHRYFK